MAIVEIPTRTDIPAYKIKIDLDDVTYTMQFYFNARMNRWHLNILTDNEEPLLMGIPVHVNVDLVGRFKETNKTLPQGTMFATNSTSEYVEPFRDNFSTDVRLYYSEAN